MSRKKRSIIYLSIFLLLLAVSVTGVCLMKNDSETAESQKALKQKNEVAKVKKSVREKKEDSGLKGAEAASKENSQQDVAVSENSVSKAKDSLRVEQAMGSKSSSNTSDSKKAGSSSDSKKPSESSKPSHTHTWVEQTKVVHHGATGHNEQVLVKAAWTEEVPVYEVVAIEVCGNCGADCTADPSGHIKEHMLNGTGQYGTHTEYVQKQTGTQTINHPAEYTTKWVRDSAAWDETVVTGYKCSCGATK